MKQAQPTTTPPGGGSWTWDAEQGAWVKHASAAPAEPTAQPPATPVSTVTRKAAAQAIATKNPQE